MLLLFSVRIAKNLMFVEDLLIWFPERLPGRVAQLVGHLTRKSEVLGSIPGLVANCRFSFR